MLHRLALLGLLVLTGCTAPIKHPDLGELYDRNAQFYDEHRNPVIVIPGILGSKLKAREDGTVVWGAFSGDFADPGTDAGARLIAVPMQEGIPLNQLPQNVVQDGSLDRVRISVFGLPIELSAYAQILGTLGVGGYRDEQLALAGAIDYGDEHFTCFQFAYDWRLDNAENARRLGAFIREKQVYVREEMLKRYGSAPETVKFDIVAHSMGGMITRYYMRYGEQPLPEDGSVPEITWAGAENIDTAILVGTPSAGSVYAAQQLVKGVQFAPILPSYPSSLLGTFPSIYQLLTRPRHGSIVDADTGEAIDVFDPAEWERLEWGLADPDEMKTLRRLLPDAPDDDTRRRIALDHLHKCLVRAKQFSAAIDAPSPPGRPSSLYLVAGDAEPTADLLEVDAGTGRTRITRKGPGDGTVTRSSALMDERLDGDWTPQLRSPVDWSHVMFLFTNHIGLTADPAFTDNVLYLLMERPRP